VTLKVLEGKRVGVDVEGKGGLNGDVHDHETLATEPVGQNLDGVTDQETGPGDRVHDSEHPDEEDHGLVGAGGSVLVPETGGEGPEDEGGEHTTGGGKEHGPTADLVDEQGHGDGDNEGETHLAGRETELAGGVLLVDTGRLVQKVGIVGDNGVTGPLGEEAEREKDGKAVAVALGLEEVGVAAVLAALKFHADSLLDFAVLELDGRVVPVAVGVVLGEDIKGLLVLILGNQETGGLGDPVDESELNERWESLQEGRNTPGPFVAHEIGSEGNPGDDYVPKLLVTLESQLGTGKNPATYLEHRRSTGSCRQW